MHAKAFDPADVRYIKLGPGNAWWDHARQHNLLELGHIELPHELALTGDLAAIRAGVAAYKPSKATSFATELHAFYHLPAGSLWITFVDGLMWWATAGDEMRWLGESPKHGARARILKTPWQSTDFNGKPLDMLELPGSLTRTSGFRQSICKVAGAEQAIQRIRSEESALTREASDARKRMVGAADAMIKRLQPKDFEIFVDLLFSSGGWRRQGALGTSAQRDTDMVLLQAVTGESAFVQVKSAADTSDFRASVEAFQRSPQDRMFFVCHSPSGEWGEPPEGALVLAGERLAERAIETGHFDWLLAKTR